MDKFINANQIIERAAATIAELESQGRYGEAQKYHWLIGQIDATLAADVVSAEDYLAIQDKCCELAKTLDATADTIASLEREIEDLNEELCGADNDFDEIWAENQSMKQQIEDLRDVVGKFVEDAAKTEREKLAIEERIDKIQRDIRDKYNI
jgi:cell division protein FtsB